MFEMKSIFSDDDAVLAELHLWLYSSTDVICRDVDASSVSLSLCLSSIMEAWNLVKHGLFRLEIPFFGQFWMIQMVKHGLSHSGMSLYDPF